MDLTKLTTIARKAFEKANNSEVCKTMLIKASGAMATYFTTRWLKQAFESKDGKKKTTTVKVETEVEGSEARTLVDEKF